MLRWIARRRLAAFENAFGYNASYMYEMLDVSWPAFLRFSQAAKLAQHREDVPLDAWHAVKIAAVLAEDCGPCTQLVVAMAEAEGVSMGVLRGILEGDEAAMGQDAALAWRFAHAVLAHHPRADSLREQVIACWGKRGLLSLALAMSASRLFPSVKYALGHAHACTRIRVGDAEMRPVHHIPA
ncbi:MAG TPA: hypothetical protein VFF81_10845 [Noviherbaspirillum sp.]|nr:hypothetical protein [Noviherbaspirillum sp.]